jgi:hypothetical protein
VHQSTTGHEVLCFLVCIERCRRQRQRRRCAEQRGPHAATISVSWSASSNSVDGKEGRSGLHRHRRQNVSRVFRGHGLLLDRVLQADSRPASRLAETSNKPPRRPQSIIQKKSSARGGHFAHEDEHATAMFCSWIMGSSGILWTVYASPSSSLYPLSRLRRSLLGRQCCFFWVLHAARQTETLKRVFVAERRPRNCRNGSSTERLKILHYKNKVARFSHFTNLSIIFTYMSQE